MAQILEVSDSTDWLSTPLSHFASVESLLRCQVCKDFYTTPMITSCLHTFCSLCIRKCLSVDGRCPTCRNQENEKDLRRNDSVLEVVEAFQSARAPALTFARQKLAAVAPASRGSKRKRGDSELEAADGEPSSQGAVTRSRSRHSASMSQFQAEEETFVEDSPIDEDYRPDHSMVPCPVCHRLMKIEAVEPHLDKCMAPSDDSPIKSPPKTSPFGSSSRNPRAQAQNPPPNRLPKLSYGILKERDLRRKLQELRIPASGSRVMLEKRHTEWVNLVNSNCDAPKPRSRKDLLHELDTWERSQGGGITLLQSSTRQGGTIAAKDFDQKTYSTDHDDDFKKLIEDAKRKKATLKKTDIDSTGEERSAEGESIPVQTPQLNGFSSKVPTNGVSDKTSTEQAVIFGGVKDNPPISSDLLPRSQIKSILPLLISSSPQAAAAELSDPIIDE